jgi:hypothetical protein
MVKVYIDNQTDKIIFVSGSEGTDWGGSVTSNGVAPEGFTKVGEMTDPTSPSSDHWGWIFIRLYGQSKPLLQLYVAAGTSRGLFDYAVQYYDGGKNRTGDTIAQTEVRKTDDGVVFTIRHVFDPWTSRIPNERMLHEITIPGTHDSATRGLLEPSECQDTTIEDQLMMGVRYFDIRLDSSTDDLRVIHGGAHGSGNTDFSFKDVAQMFRDFLTGERGFKSTKETVIVQVKADRWDRVDTSVKRMHEYEVAMHPKVVSKLKEAFSGEEDRLYMNPIRSNLSNIPTIGDLRGKLVFLRRYDCNDEDGPETGTPVKYFASGLGYNAWSANPVGSWQERFETDNFEWPDPGDNMSHFHGQLIDYRNRHGLSFVIQDRYNDCESFIGKYGLVRTYLDKASQGGSPDSWFLNFASYSKPVASAGVINPQLEKYFKDPPKPKPRSGFGTILMDFAEPELVRSIIATNF